MKTLLVLCIWFAVIALLWYINRNAKRQTEYMNNQFVSHGERTRQAQYHEREWVDQMEKFK